MANNNNPHGLRPLGFTMEGGPLLLFPFAKVVGYGTAIFMNDAVNRPAGVGLEASATPGTTTYSGVSMDFSAASTAATHLVIVSLTALFEAQDNAVSAGVVAANCGLNANLVLTAGSTTTRQSKHQINETGIAVTSTLDVKLLQLYNIPDNAFGPNARIEIVFNKHRMAPATAGV